MLDPSPQLICLQFRFDRLASGADKSGSSRVAHTAILDYLASSRARAEAAGWAACDIERVGGMGRLRLVEVAPSQPLRGECPEPN